MQGLLVCQQWQRRRPGRWGGEKERSCRQRGNTGQEAARFGRTRVVRERAHDAYMPLLRGMLVRISRPIAAHERDFSAAIRAFFPMRILNS